MRKVASIPADKFPESDKYDIRNRAAALVEQWGDLLKTGTGVKEDAGDVVAPVSSTAPAATGDAAMVDGDAAAAPTSDAPVLATNGHSEVVEGEKLMDVDPIVDVAPTAVDTPVVDEVLADAPIVAAPEVEMANGEEAPTTDA